MNFVRLNNGYHIPEIGVGTFPYKEELQSIIPKMIEAGYRLFDTADNYQNEQFIGEALSCLERGVLAKCIVMTKYSSPKRKVQDAFNESSYKLFSKTASPDRKADIYLMHWPYPHLWERRWREMEELYMSGEYCKAIGVCNFNEKTMGRLLSICRVKPMINQFECHPTFQQRGIIELCDRENIQVISYSPLARVNKGLFENESLMRIAEAHNISISQAILKWNIQERRIPIPATKNEKHLYDNINLSGFQLTNEELRMIDELERGMRIRFDPEKRFSFKQRISFLLFSLNVKFQ